MNKLLLIVCNYIQTNVRNVYTINNIICSSKIDVIYKFRPILFINFFNLNRINIKFILILNFIHDRIIKRNEKDYYCFYQII